MEILTASRIRCFRDCPRKHRLRYVEGWRAAREPDALALGTAVHAALEEWWDRANAGKPILANALDRLGGLEDPVLVAKAEAMIAGYHTAWFHDVPKYEVLELETEFVIPLVNPESGRASRTWKLAGKLDGLVRERDTGDLYVLEHKTTSDDISPGSAYWKRLRLDTQVSVYLLGAKALGHGEPVGVIYDVLRKPAHRFGKNDTAGSYLLRMVDAIAADPAKYYARQVVRRMERETREAMTELWLQAQMMHEFSRRGIAPPNADACVRFGTCEFFPVCAGEATLEEGELYRRAARQHEELSPRAE